MSEKKRDKFYVKAEHIRDAWEKFGEWATDHNFKVDLQSLKLDHKTIGGLEIWSVEAAE